jgi:predicted transcriptional regulator
MTKTTQRIVDIAERLDPERQRMLLEIAEGMAGPRNFYDAMTAQDREELERSLQEADRGDGVTQEELNARLDAVVASARK